MSRITSTSPSQQIPLPPPLPPPLKSMSTHTQSSKSQSANVSKTGSLPVPLASKVPSNAPSKVPSKVPSKEPSKVPSNVPRDRSDSWDSEESRSDHSSSEPEVLDVGVASQKSGLQQSRVSPGVSTRVSPKGSSRVSPKISSGVSPKISSRASPKISSRESPRIVTSNRSAAEPVTSQNDVPFFDEEECTESEDDFSFPCCIPPFSPRYPPNPRPQREWDESVLPTGTNIPDVLGTPCRRCGRDVYLAELHLSSRGPYHTECYKCCLCGKSLDSWSVAEYKGEVFCMGCYRRNFGTHGCGFGLGAGVLQTP